MATNINGVIYYKLDADTNGYLGDITKNCGLRGEEIDGNFNFLRGSDIEKVNFDENGNMHITKFNGEVLTANKIVDPKDKYNFEYDSNNGVLTIVTPEGEEIKLTGFMVESDIKYEDFIPQANVYHDFSLQGKGTKEEPLHLSNVCKTGRYKPAIKLIDTTLIDENGKHYALPTENIAKFDRYVTKEKNSLFGKLYPLSGVKEIQKRLKEINSEWRVPSKEEWDLLLNTIDCYNPEHDKKGSNVYLGENAGAILKSTAYWREYNGNLYSDDTYGFTIYPVGYASNRGKDYYGSFGETSVFWTSTEEDSYNDMYVKMFDYKEPRVGQNTWGEECYLSLRLVKDYDFNNPFEDAEDIDGLTVNCVHIPGQHLIWTKENIGFSQAEYKGFSPAKWDEYSNDMAQYRFFVNEWDGHRWIKHEIREGEGIVIHENEKGNKHEWILVNGVLTDSADIIKNELSSQLDDIVKSINELDTKIQDEATARNNQIQNEVINREGADTVLDAKIQDEANARNNAVATLEGKIQDEANARNNAVATLEGKIQDEANARNNTDTALNETINTVKENLQNQINRNKVEAEDATIIVTTNSESENITPTTIKVKLDTNCNQLKFGEDGIYFDGYFGEF